MKKFIALSTLLVGAIIFTGCQQKQANQKQPTADQSTQQKEQQVENQTEPNDKLSQEEENDWKIYKNSELGFEFKYPNYLMFQNNDPATRSLWRIDQHEDLIVDKKSISGIDAPEWIFELNTKKNDDDIIVDEIIKDNYKLIVARPYQMLGCFYYIESTKINIRFLTMRECNDELSKSILSTFILTK